MTKQVDHGVGVCGCLWVCGCGMLICFVSALGSHEMGRHKLPIIIIILPQCLAALCHEQCEQSVSSVQKCHDYAMSCVSVQCIQELQTVYSKLPNSE